MQTRPCRITTLPDGEGSVRETLKMMRLLARNARRSLFIRDLATSIISNVKEKNWGKEVDALLAFVQTEIRYTRDPVDMELLQTPEELLRSQQGDCDDKATLLAALLESVGHPTRFKAVGFSPNTLSHVYVETKIGNRWVPMDPTMPKPLGWQPPNIRRSMIIHIGDTHA